MVTATSIMPRQWSWTHVDKVIMGVILTFDLCIIESPPLLVRLALGILLVSSTMIPYIRRFTVPTMPIFTWLITFYAARFIPLDYRPNHIFVNVLPSLERILYGANLSEIISKNQHPVLDVLAWLPYGVIHFSLPFIFALVLFIFGPPKSLPVYAQAFGWMNLAGVLTQLCFPNASPWYELSYGSAPADYTVPGEAGGLARIDTLLGLNLYGSSFGASPLVFGAFPSLHSGSATIEMCFFVYLFPRLWPVAIGYTMWMWFATMYLTHHYLIDLVGGSIYAFSTFFVARCFLPPLRNECKTRLQYLGIQPLSVRAFLRSIEFRLNYGNLLPLTSKDAAEAAAAGRSTIEDLSMEGDDMFALKEPLALRMRRLDGGVGSSSNTSSSDEEENAGLSYSGTSTPAEPASPITPRSPFSLSQFPFHSKS